MKTVVLGRPPAELEAVIVRSRALGQDTYDEVWDGDYHVAPAGTGKHGSLQMRIGRVIHARIAVSGLEVTGPVNIGGPQNSRVPDAAVLRSTDEAWFPTAELVVEVVSPANETHAKLDFCARQGVGELVIVDPAISSVELYERARDGKSYEPVRTSRLLGMTAAELRDAFANC